MLSIGETITKNMFKPVAPCMHGNHAWEPPFAFLVQSYIIINIFAILAKHLFIFQKKIKGGEDLFIFH